MAITILNIGEAKRENFDETWAIVRSWKNNNHWMKHIPELSPSWGLFSTYRKLVSENNWNEQSFKNIYLPQFLKEMHSKEATQKLNELYQLDKQGKSIALICFCKEEQLCHRSIVAGLLQGVKANVVVPSGKNYSQYYDEYKKG